MNKEQLMEAVRNLLTVKHRQRAIVCDVCGAVSNDGVLADDFRCEACIRTHAQLVLQHAESCSAADAC